MCHRYYRAEECYRRPCRKRHVQGPAWQNLNHVVHTSGVPYGPYGVPASVSNPPLPIVAATSQPSPASVSNPPLPVEPSGFALADASAIRPSDESRARASPDGEPDKCAVCFESDQPIEYGFFHAPTGDSHICLCRTCFGRVCPQGIGMGKVGKCPMCNCLAPTTRINFA